MLRTVFLLLLKLIMKPRSRTKHILEAELPCLVQDETQTVIHVLLLWFNVGANSSQS